MDNNNDKKNVIEQINQLKMYNEKAKECLSSIQLVMVDDNNSRVKDASFKNELGNLSEQINSISSSLSNLEKDLR